MIRQLDKLTMDLDHCRWSCNGHWSLVTRTGDTIETPWIHASLYPYRSGSQAALSSPRRTISEILDYTWSS